MEASEHIEKFQEFFEGHKEELHEIAINDLGSFNIDFSDISKFDPELSEELLNEPEDVLKAAELAVANMELPNVNIRVRVFNLPKTKLVKVRDIRSIHINKFINVEGIVRQTSDVRPQVVSAAFECPSCGNHITILQLDSKFKEPSRCSCGRRGKFRLVSKDLVDAQRTVIEETPESLEGGEQPKRLAIFLKEDLVDPKMEKRSTPGSKISVVGTVKEVVITLSTGGQSTRYDLVMECNSIVPMEETFEDIKISKKDEKEIKEIAKDSKVYEKFVRSMAPAIYGHESIKEALVLQLMGGIKKIRPDGTKTRGDCHVLLVGDPGAAKSQLLQFVSKTAPKARYISGKGASAAGLTASVVKDEFLRGWALEAGALVLANMGVACLHPDTEILVNNKIEKISGLFDSENKLIKKSGKEEVEICEINKNVTSIDCNFSVKENKSNVLRRKWFKGKLKKIVFESGFEIKLTSDHKLIDGNSLKWKDSSNFKKGDYVVSPLNLPQNNNKIKLTDILPGWSLDYEDKRYKYWKGKSKEILNLRFLTEKLAYLIGFVYGDGHVVLNNRRSHIEIKQSLKNKEQIKKIKKYFREIFNRSIGSYVNERISTIRGRKIYSKCNSMYFGSKLFAEIYIYFIKDNLKKILTMEDKCLKSFIAGVLDSDGCISTKNYKKNNNKYKIQHIEFFFSNSIKDNLNFILALRRLDCYGKLIENVKGDVLCVRITGNKDVESFKEGIGEVSIKIVKSDKIIRKTKISSTSDKLPKKIVAKICENISRKYNKSLLLEKGIWSLIHDYKKLKRQPSRDQLTKIFSKLGGNFEKYDFLLKRDYFLDKVKSIKEEKYEGYVYDLFVPENHNFLANGIIVHNCLDELDKISEEDSSSLHESMEQQTVTISKANIQASLRTETTVLAAANPKFGRFDPYTPIAGQINMPPALINRFDLIFPIRDMPDKEKDEKIASHVLKLQRDPKILESEIPQKIIKKYIAYVKQKIFPKLTKEAIDEIKKFYVDLRNLPTVGEESAVKPIPISARQLEALVRLAEGSARVRLSKKVEREDSKRAINILKYCLMQVGFDYETGQIDIDRIGTGITASERGKIMSVREIINELEKKGLKEIPIDDILAEAAEKGIDEDKVNDAIEKLKREGEIYQPKQNFLSKT